MTSIFETRLFVVCVCRRKRRQQCCGGKCSNCGWIFFAGLQILFILSGQLVATFGCYNLDKTAYELKRNFMVNGADITPHKPNFDKLVESGYAKRIRKTLFGYTDTDLNKMYQVN